MEDCDVLKIDENDYELQQKLREEYTVCVDKDFFDEIRLDILPVSLGVIPVLCELHNGQVYEGYLKEKFLLYRLKGGAVFKKRVKYVSLDVKDGIDIPLNFKLGAVLKFFFRIDVLDRLLTVTKRQCAELNSLLSGPNYYKDNGGVGENLRNFNERLEQLFENLEN